VRALRGIVAGRSAERPSPPGQGAPLRPSGDWNAWTQEASYGPQNAAAKYHIAVNGKTGRHELLQRPPGALPADRAELAFRCS